MGYTIDIDTGGTFTDGFFVGRDRVATVKVPTTPHDLTVCFLNCVNAGAGRLGVSVEDLLYETDIVRFSNTIGTNTIIQRDGSKIGLLVTSGREDLAPIQSDNGKPPLVLPDMVLGIEERVSPEGEILKPPEETAALKAAQKLIDQGARCLVTCFANSEFNPANEQLVRKAIKAEYPRDFLGSVPVFLSSDISRRSGEIERLNAAVLNAYIHAKLVRLLYKAGEELRRRLYRRSLFIVHNNGAVARVAKTRAINTYNSGPAAGVLGARSIGQLYGVQDLISMDMGGTSFDVGYVRHGQASYSLRPDVEGLSVNVPMLAIRAIGAGGGSIASVGQGKLQVGPQSAGALPGPVCFDLGGMEPTVTDADLILGILDPDYFLGGTMKLHLDKARAAMTEKVAQPLGVSCEQAALMIKQTIDEAMGNEVKRLKSETASDVNPLLVVYGGAGPAHCCDIARIAGLKKIVITPFSAVFSAYSSSSMDVGHLYYRRVDLPFDAKSGLQALAQPLTEMRAEAERDMRGEGFSSEQISWELELFVQAPDRNREVKLTADIDLLESPPKVKALIEQARNEISSTGKAAKGAYLITTLGLRASAPIPHYQTVTSSRVDHGPEKAKKGMRSVFLSDGTKPAQVPVYDRARLGNGHQIVGPAVIESEHTTFMLSEKWKMSVDQHNNIFAEEVQ
ncbi:MAG: hydantoinase/oxoprolinase family protein [Thermodesulfobacteriota bacterium]